MDIVLTSPASGTSTEKSTRAGLSSLQFPCSAGPTASAKSEDFRLLIAVFGAAAIRLRLVNSGIGPFARALLAGTLPFKLTTGLLLSGALLTNSHGAVGFSACHNPRRSLRAARSDCW